MRGNVLVDLRNVYQQTTVDDAGLVCFGIGRPASLHQNYETHNAVDWAGLKLGLGLIQTQKAMMVTRVAPSVP
jgi:hypothetical protein